MGLYPNGQSQRGQNLGGLLGWVNLLDEGGVGDGVRDDSIALNALVSALAAGIGGTIILPPGSYKLSSSVTIPSTVGLIIASGVTLSGAGTLTISGTGVITDWRTGLAVTGTTSVGGQILPALLYVQSGVLTATSVSQPLWTEPNDTTTWKVASVAARFTVASTSGTLQVEVAGNAVAVGSGVNQLTGPISLSGTANTNNNGTVSGTPTTIQSNLFTVNLILAGTLTNLAGCVVTVGLQRLS